MAMVIQLAMSCGWNPSSWNAVLGIDSKNIMQWDGDYRDLTGSWLDEDFPSGGFDEELFEEIVSPNTSTEVSASNESAGVLTPLLAQREILPELSREDLRYLLVLVKRKIRPSSGYNKFYSHMFHRITAPPPKTVTTTISEMWKKLPRHERALWEKPSAEDLEVLARKRRLIQFISTLLENL